VSLVTVDFDDEFRFRGGRLDAATKLAVVRTDSGEREAVAIGHQPAANR
jgi:hypothetical protein